MRNHRATTACRECGHKIAFVVTSTGKRMPVNAESLDALDLEELGRINGEVTFRYKDHVSHFSTCPKAASFRR